jgi:hypothetical protein
MKTFKLFLTAFFAFAIGAFGAATLGIAPAVGALGAAGIALLTPKAQGALFTSLDVTALNAALDAYYRDNEEVFWDEIYYNPMLSERFRPIGGVTDEKPIVYHEIDFEVLPGHDKADFSPQSDAVKFGAQLLKTREAKVDLLLYPAELHRTWLGKYKRRGSDPFDLPFEADIMNGIAAKAAEKIYMNAAFGGVYNAAGTTTSAIADGYLKLTANLITANTITPVATGAVTASNVITAVEAMCDAIDVKYRTQQRWELKVSDTIFNWYWKKRRELYPNLIQAYAGNVGLVNSLPIEGYNVTLVREIGLGSSQRMIATPHDNMGWLFDDESDISNFEVQRFNRGLKIMLDMKVGFGFIRALDGYLVTNDQA